jgi:hypothetical protein
MSESIRSICYFILIAAAVAGALGWSSISPDPLVWFVRIGCSTIGLLCLVIALRFRLRRDIAPDYLSRRRKKHFSRDGLSFSVAAVAEKGIFYFEVAFQNQQDQPSKCRVGVRPVRCLFGSPKIAPITIDIECAPAAYGLARVPIPLAKKVQGKRLLFEVGASVEYPRGKGRQLRFREGSGIMTNAEFRDTSGTLLGVAFGPMLKYTRSLRSQLTIDLPAGVAEQLPGPVLPEARTLWQLGDAPLPSAH